MFTSANKRPTLFTSVECFFGVLIFPKIMLESWGRGLYTSAAYTQVFTVKDAFYQANIVCCIFYDSVCSVEAT